MLILTYFNQIWHLWWCRTRWKCYPDVCYIQFRYDRGLTGVTFLCKGVVPVRAMKGCGWSGVNGTSRKYCVTVHRGQGRAGPSCHCAEIE